MAEQIVQADWDWTMSLDTDDEEQEMTIALQCIDTSIASYLSKFGLLAALTLLISTSI